MQVDLKKGLKRNDQQCKQQWIEIQICRHRKYKSVVICMKPFGKYRVTGLAIDVLVVS